jgi:hypothetical protein
MWSKTSNSVAQVENGIYNFQLDSTAYAYWSEVAVVHFNPNGGSGSMADQGASTPTALSQNTFTRPGFAFNGWRTANGTVYNGMVLADGAIYPFKTSEPLSATWVCVPLRVEAWAKRLGAARVQVLFRASSSESPWTSFTASAEGKEKTVTQSSDIGDIIVDGLNNKNGYTFDVTARNEAGCVYKGTANRVQKW